MFIVYCHITSYFKIEWLKTVITIFHAFSRSDIPREAWLGSSDLDLSWDSVELSASSAVIYRLEGFISQGGSLTAGRLAVSVSFYLVLSCGLSYLSTWWQVSWARRASKKVHPFNDLAWEMHSITSAVVVFSIEFSIVLQCSQLFSGLFSIGWGKHSPQPDLRGRVMAFPSLGQKRESHIAEAAWRIG